MLTRTMVQILSQASPFTIGYARDLLIRPLPLSHLMLEGCRPFMHPAIQLMH